MRSLASSRAAHAGLPARLYESHFMCAWDPGGGRAVWIRYTSLKRPGEPARPTVWLTWFDRSGSGPHLSPRAVRETADSLESGSLWSSSPLGAIGPGVARGALDGASWEIEWSARAGELPYLPARWLYDRPVPRSNGAALAPSAVVLDGTLTVDGVAVALAGWDATVGHNWGSDHADQWSWIHAGGLGADGTGWLDLTLARVRIGPVLTPWIAAGAVMLDGRTYRPARRSRVRRTIAGRSTTVSLALAGGAGVLELQIDAPPESTVTWDYAAPAGAGRVARHCSVADAVIRVGAAPPLEVHARLAVEHGGPA
jgi:hypothetical protein